MTTKAAVSEYTTGTARYTDNEGKESEICWECAYDIALRDMNKDGETFGYWTPHNDSKPLRYDEPIRMWSPDDPYAGLGHITTWTGKPLLAVYSVVRRRSYGYNYSDRYYFKAKAADGTYWHGIGQGEGMYARMKRNK